MTIELKLENPIFCTGCPLFQEDYYRLSTMCRFHYWNMYGGKTENGPQRRPQKCIDGHGK